MCCPEPAWHQSAYSWQLGQWDQEAQHWELATELSAFALLPAAWFAELRSLPAAASAAAVMLGAGFVLATAAVHWVWQLGQK